MDDTGADRRRGTGPGPGYTGPPESAQGTGQETAQGAAQPCNEVLQATDRGRARPAPRVLVLGGAGFIGRHVVGALRAQGAHPIIGSRHPRRRLRRLHGAAGACETHFEHQLTPGDWHALLQDCDAVINCVGILRQRWGETYDRVHHRAPAALAAACATRGLRLVHVSALGLDGPARSRFLTSKRAGEDAIRAAGGDWHIVRPSLLDGEGGFGARWMRRVARWPIHPLPRGAVGRIAALDVGDLGHAIARLALAERDSALLTVREHDLGGDHTRTLGEHLAALRAVTGRAPAVVLRVPDPLVRLTAHLCDLLHCTPRSFGHWELLQRDNLPRESRLARLLGLTPQPVGRAIPAAMADDCRRPGTPPLWASLDASIGDP